MPPALDSIVSELSEADRQERIEMLIDLAKGLPPLPERLARCVTPGEAYHVPGLGPGFWTPYVRLLDPGTIPLWCPADYAFSISAARGWE